MKKLCISIITALCLIVTSCTQVTEPPEIPTISQLEFDSSIFDVPPSYAAFQDGSYHMTVTPYDDFPFSGSGHELNQYDKISLYHYSRYFDEDIYNRYTIDQIDASSRFYIDIPLIEGTHRVRFLQYDPSWYPPGGSFPSLWIEAIECDGVYSYVLNLTAHSFAGSVFNYQQDLFNVIYHDETFPYTVYVEEDMIFFMSKDEHFRSDYLWGFVENPQMFLFKP